MLYDLAHIKFSGTGAGSGKREEAAFDVVGARTARERRLAETTVTIDPFAAWVLERNGLRASAYRPQSLQRRSAACQRYLGVGCGEAGRALLERFPERLPAALSSLLIGVTEFFRDTGVFERLKREVLPRLTEVNGAVRVYAPGVSAGHELYSVAMCLAEAGLLERAELLGLDCRPDAIAAARAGVFSAAAMEGVPEAWRERYFEAGVRARRAKPEFARRIRWQVGDLFSYRDRAPWSLILFRNVSIYFTAAHAARAWEIICTQLAPGGILVVGKAEKPSEQLPLERVTTSIYRKVPT